MSAQGRPEEPRGLRASPSASGAVAPDGSPVAFYLQLPPGRDPEIVDAAIEPGYEVLELGCGTGRMTHRLLELGHAVVAVDQSPEMLAHVRGAETVEADIQALDLGRRFRAVVLASHFVNAPDLDLRTAILRACARHVSDDGSVVIQRHDPRWDPEPGDVTTGVLGRARISTRVVDRRGDVLDAVATYRVGDQVWEQRYSARLLDDDATVGALRQGGLELDRWLEPRTWLTARRAGEER